MPLTIFTAIQCVPEELLSSKFIIKHSSLPQKLLISSRMKQPLKLLIFSFLQMRIISKLLSGWISLKSAPTNFFKRCHHWSFCPKKRPSPEFCVPRFKPLPVSMNKPPPTVFKQIPLQSTHPPLVMVLISAKPRPNLFRIGTMNDLLQEF